MICAIHQPNFFPWLGYFDKIRRAGVFIFLDDVQYTKHSWTNRVRLHTGNGEGWSTIPLPQSGLLQTSIKDVPLPAGDWRKKLKNRLQMSYGKAPFFPQYRDIVFHLVDYDTAYLADFNIHAVTTIAGWFELAQSTRFLRSSAMGITESSTERLISLTKAAGCDSYLTGGGAAGYQDDALMVQAGVEVLYQNFQHPVYLQKKEAPFIPGLSVLDYLFFCGNRFPLSQVGDYSV